MNETLKVVIDTVEVTITPKGNCVVYETIYNSEHFKVVTNLFDLEIRSVRDE